MIDIGDLPLALLLTAYLIAHILRAPLWLRVAIAIPSAFFAVWRVVLGSHIRVPETLGVRLSYLVLASAPLFLIGALMLAAQARREGAEAEGSPTAKRKR